MAQSKSKLISIAVVAAMFACTLGAYVGLQVFAKQQPSALAVVHDSRGGIHSLDLAQNQTVTITTDLGTNVIQVQDGSIRVIQADCPNGDCMQQGAINTPAQQIVCLPHQLWIEVTGEAASDGIDAVAR